MSSHIAIPSLSQWAEQRLTALYKATDKASLEAAYDAFLAADAQITVNGKHLSGDAYKKQLLASKVLETGAQVVYSGAVEVPENTHRPAQAGSVGLFLHATVDEVNHPVIRGPSQVTASYNLTIVQEPHRGEIDARRVSVLTQISVDRVSPVL